MNGVTGWICNVCGTTIPSGYGVCMACGTQKGTTSYIMEGLYYEFINISFTPLDTNYFLNTSHERKIDR